MTDTSTADIDPAAIRGALLDAVFATSARIGAAFGISGRALYESLVPLAEDATLACVAVATAAGADGKGVTE